MFSLNNFKWYRILRKGRWERIEDRLDRTYFWYRNREFDLTIFETITDIEYYQ